MNRLYLVRHGESFVNLTKEFSCRKVDKPLTPKGVLQSEQTAAWFRDKGVQEIYSSPLKRAAETAAIIAAPLGLPVTLMEQFREVNVGDMEDWPPTLENWKIHNEVFQAWGRGRLETAFPGGENYFMLVARMRDGLTTVLRDKDNRTLVVVTHGGIALATITSICQDVNVPELLRVGFDNCAISELEIGLQDGRFKGRVVSWGVSSHLSGEAAEMTSPIPTELYESARG